MSGSSAIGPIWFRRITDATWVEFTALTRMSKVKAVTLVEEQRRRAKDARKGATVDEHRVDAYREFCRQHSVVHVTPLQAAEIDRYLATGEWRGKAGGYAIQGLAETFVRMLQGSHSGVIGLPLYETVHLLEGAGYPVVRAWMARPPANIWRTTRLSLGGSRSVWLGR